MKSAGSVLRELERDVDSIQESLELIEHKLRKSRGAKAELANRIQMTLRDIAINDLDLADLTSDAKLPSAVKQHIQLRKTVEEKATKQLAEQTVLWNQRNEQLNHAITEHQKRLDKINEAFESLESTVAIRRDIDVLAEQLEAQKSRLSSVEPESTLKINEYKAQPFFQYLVSKYFGDPKYSGHGLVARIDRWLARRTKFDQNSKQLQLLLAMIVRVREDVEETQDKLDRKRIELDVLQQESQKDKELVALNVARLQNDRDVRQIEKDIQVLKATTDKIKARQDEHSTIAIKLLVEKYTAAAEEGFTGVILNPEHGPNRVLMKEIDQLRTEESQKEREIGELERSLDERQRANRLANSFLREFKQKRFHDEKYEYRNGLNASDLLSAFLVGTITSSEALSQMGKSRKEIPQPESDFSSTNSWSGSSSGTRRSSSEGGFTLGSSKSRDNDSFSSSDSIGGDRSSTTDSF